MFKFIHTADIHLDSPLRGLERYEGAPVDEIRQATRRALENLVALAIDEQVAFVLFAGDLYDGDWPDYHTGLFFVSQMVRLQKAGIQVFLVAGNHDAANEMTRALPLPDNVRMLSHREPETVLLDALPVAIHGQGFATAAVVENLAASYPQAVPGRFNVGLLHTSATGREGHERYAPCSLEDLKSRQYDYWALGHIHRREVLSTDPPIVFCGNLQGRHIGECGAKSCTLVTVDDAHRPRLEERHVDVARWALGAIDAADAATRADVLDRVRGETGRLLAKADGRPLAVRVAIRGACPAHREIAGMPRRWTADVRAAVIEASGGAAWLEKVVTQTRPLHTHPPTEEAAGPLAALTRQTAELRTDRQRAAELLDEELAALRNKLPAELVEGDGAIDLTGTDALEAMIDDVEQLLVRRLTRQEDAS
jgi:DNA repair exonuclease SbcCD nuclease subunit